jgi:excisionase family DNA binding protein
MSERDPKIPDLVSKAEAADILGVSHQAVQQMIDKGRLRGAKIGSTWVFRRAAVNEMVNTEKLNRIAHTHQRDQFVSDIADGIQELADKLKGA